MKYLLIFIALVCVLLDAYFGVEPVELALFGIDDLAAATLGSALLGGITDLFGSSSASSSAQAQAAAIRDAASKQAEATKYSSDQYLFGVQATNQMNREENALARQFQWDMWNATNEYNDPKNEVARLLAAGLNPAFQNGTPASMESAPSQIGMQAPQQTSVPDMVTPAVSAAQVEQSGMQQAYGLRMQAFQDIGNSLMQAFTMAKQNKEFGLQKSIGDKMLDVYDAQIKNLGSQTSLYNEQEWNMSMQRIMERVNQTYQRLNDFQQRLESSSRIKLNDATMNHLTWQMTVQWPKEMMLNSYNAETGRMSALTGRAALQHEIQKWNDHNIPGFGKLPYSTQQSITNWIGQQTIQNLMTDFSSDRLLMLMNDKMRSRLGTWRDPADNWWKDVFDMYVNPFTSNLPMIGTESSQSENFINGQSLKKNAYRFKW